MRHLFRVCAIFALLVPLSSFACRELVDFPAHLEVDASKYYYLVRIERAEGQNFIGKVEHTFGGTFLSGKVVTIQFKAGEEAHAVCPIDIVPGNIYLLRSESNAGVLEISRFNWLNIPADHKRFKIYVQDLEWAQGKR